MAYVYTARRLPLAAVSQGFYRLLRIDPDREQDWKGYAKSVLAFSVCFFGVLYLTQMAVLAVQQYVSAAVGLAVLAAVARGLARRTTNEIGNFWVDLYRSL